MYTTIHHCIMIQWYYITVYTIVYVPIYMKHPVYMICRLHYGVCCPCTDVQINLAGLRLPQPPSLATAWKRKMLGQVLRMGNLHNNVQHQCIPVYTCIVWIFTPVQQYISLCNWHIFAGLCLLAFTFHKKTVYFPEDLLKTIMLSETPRYNGFSNGM